MMHLKTNQLGLGIDAGGTATRWALATPAGIIIAEGHVAGLSGLLMKDEAGREMLRSTLQQLARDARSAQAALLAQVAQVTLSAAGSITNTTFSRVYAGVTGYEAGSSHSADGVALIEIMASALQISSSNITLGHDLEIAYHDIFAPGEGYVVYAGTGSIAAFIDAEGAMHRAGGRGAALDDGGGGYWIAREALRYIWRAEDERPDSWRDSPLAIEMFKRIGGTTWDASREFVYGGASRGDIGKLALAVARAAGTDPAAHAILQGAGAELARLGMAMLHRFGTRPMALAGRAIELHPAIEQSCRAHLPAGTELKVVVSQAHLAAARIAAKK